MATQVVENAAEIPLETLNSSSGVAIDFGFATTKVAYRPRGEGQHASQGTKSDLEVGSVNCAMFEAEAIGELIEFIKTECDLQNSKVINVCGRGFSKDIKVRLEGALNCQVSCDRTYTGLQAGLRHLLSSQSSDQLFYPPVPEGLALGQKSGELITGIFPGREIKSGELEPFNEGDTSPVLVVDLGATFRFLKVDLDNGKEPELLSETNMGGNFFQGICGFFIPEKDYPSLQKLAEECTGRSVETTFQDLQASLTNQGDDFYSNMGSVENPLLSQLRMFIMDKMLTNNREDVVLGDGVQSMMNTICENVMSHVYYMLMASGCRRVCFTGSWIHAPVYRKWLTVQFITRHIWFNKGESVEYGFLRSGSYVGALGALLR